MKMVPLKHLLTVFFVFLYTEFISRCGAIEIDLTIEIMPGTRECFYQNMKPNVEFEIEYQVVDGGEFDVNFFIQSPSGKILLTDIRKQDALHKKSSQEEGDYMFCLDNTFSRFASKTVFFELLTDEDEEDGVKDWNGAPDENDDTYDVKVEDIRKTLDAMKANLEKSISTLNILRVIESRDRSQQEDNFTRVNFWSGVQVFIMLSVALTQVLLIRSLFADPKSSKPMKLST